MLESVQILIIMRVSVGTYDNVRKKRLCAKLRADVVNCIFTRIAAGYGAFLTEGFASLKASFSEGSDRPTGGPTDCPRARPAQHSERRALSAFPRMRLHFFVRLL